MNRHDKWNSADIAQHTYRPEPQEEPVNWAFAWPVVFILSIAFWAVAIPIAIDAYAPCGAC